MQTFELFLFYKYFHIFFSSEIQNLLRTHSLDPPARCGYLPDPLLEPPKYAAEAPKRSLPKLGKKAKKMYSSEQKLTFSGPTRRALRGPPEPLHGRCGGGGSLPLPQLISTSKRMDGRQTIQINSKKQEMQKERRDSRESRQKPPSGNPDAWWHAANTTQTSYLVGVIRWHASACGTSHAKQNSTHISVEGANPSRRTFYNSSHPQTRLSMVPSSEMCFSSKLGQVYQCQPATLPDGSGDTSVPQHYTTAIGNFFWKLCKNVVMKQKWSMNWVYVAGRSGVNWCNRWRTAGQEVGGWDELLRKKLGDAQIFGKILWDTSATRDATDVLHGFVSWQCSLPECAESCDWLLRVKHNETSLLLTLGLLIK